MEDTTLTSWILASSELYVAVFLFEKKPAINTISSVRWIRIPHLISNILHAYLRPLHPKLRRPDPTLLRTNVDLSQRLLQNLAEFCRSRS